MGHEYRIFSFSSSDIAYIAWRHTSNQTFELYTQTENNRQWKKYLHFIFTHLKLSCRLLTIWSDASCFNPIFHNLFSEVVPDTNLEQVEIKKPTRVRSCVVAEK